MNSIIAICIFALCFIAACGTTNAKPTHTNSKAFAFAATCEDERENLYRWK